MKSELVKVLAAVGLAFYVLPLALYLILPGQGTDPGELFTADFAIALVSLLGAAIVGVYGAWRDRPALIWGAGLVFAVVWFIDGSLLWVVPGLLFLSSAILSTARA